MRLNTHLILLLACLLAASMPFFTPAPGPAKDSGFPGWPSTYDGKPLHALPLSPLEARFADSFPGKIGRFSDGQREIILRWVAAETRKLHPAADCFRGSGYAVQTLPIRRSRGGQQWGRFRATRGHDAVVVEERIFDARGQQWSDVSAWYWSALWTQSEGPWWAITIAQTENPSALSPAQAKREMAGKKTSVTMTD